MKILIDIGHPAHVHYLKKFIPIMEEKGHSLFIVARDKEIALQLLDFYKFPYLNRGKGSNGKVGKLVYMLRADLLIFRHALKIKPDVFLSFGSMYAAQIAWLIGKPHIALDDTDHNFFQQALYIPFTKVLLTPKVFQKDFGSRQIRFDSFLELFSLHPKRFIPVPGVVEAILNESKENRYVILRFVSWEASHDAGLKGLSSEDKYTLVRQLSRYARVIISSESTLPADLMDYAYAVHPAEMHDILHGASLLISESLTMAAEAAFLGTPSLCISTARAGTLDEEVKLGLIELFRTSDGLLQRALYILLNPDYKPAFKAWSHEKIRSKVDLTAFLVWFVEMFPQSKEILKNQPGYPQEHFTELSSS